MTTPQKKEGWRMAKPSLPLKLRFAFAAVAGLTLVLTAMVMLATPAQADKPTQETEAYCLSCHSNPDLTMTLPSGEVLPLYVDPEVLSQSVHSPQGIECEACHTEIKTYPHPEISYQTRRELSRSYYLACQKCHSANYAKTLDSMHAHVAEAGDLNAPVCTDCHGAHDVKPPDEPRALISETCGQCHTAIFENYKDSIHGGALIREDNPDVPVCTDCHGVHNIQDPRTAQFRVETPDLCAGCHADQELMSKYGLSADVYSLYETSWHGVDVSVYKANWPTIWHESAVCTDCHGVHDIRTTGDPDSRVNPENLLTTCQQCHPDAGPNWTSAWTGHNRISLERTPYLYYVDVFYSSFTTFVLWACVIYVILQIVRATVERVRRSLS
jgi:predicted CXXCH cytochrome family protein